MELQKSCHNLVTEQQAHLIRIFIPSDFSLHSLPPGLSKVFVQCLIGCTSYTFTSILLSILMLIFSHVQVRVFSISSYLCLILQLCPTLHSPMDYSLPGSCVHGLFPQEYWSGLSFTFPGCLPDSGVKPSSLALTRVCAKSHQSCQTLQSCGLKIQ